MGEIMTDQLLTALAYDGQIRILVLRANDVVQEAQKRHGTWHTATAALGRTLVATLLLSANAKGDERISVEVAGVGPIGRIVSEGDGNGNVRGYASNPHVALELNAQGKLDVAGAVGLPGVLTVRKLLGNKELFSGQVPLVSGELAEDFTYYMATSEQTPSSIGLSVLVNADESVAAAGGFMIQVMPGATEETLCDVEEHLACLGRFSDLLASGKTLEELLCFLVGENNAEILEKQAIQFHCQYDRAYFERGLLSVGREEIEAMIAEDKGAEVVCHYCNEHYQFTEQELQDLLESATQAE